GQQFLLIGTCVVGGNDLLRLRQELPRHLKRGPAKGHGQRPVGDDVLIADDTCGNTLGYKARPQDMRLPGIEVAADCRKHDRQAGLREANSFTPAAASCARASGSSATTRRSV